MSSESPLRFKLLPQNARLRMIEDDIEQQCRDLLELNGWLVMRNQSGTAKSPDGRRWIKLHEKGTPDYTCIRGRAVFMLETKRPGKGLSPDQVKRHGELRRFFGVEIVTVDSVEALDAWLKQQFPRE